MLKNILNLNGVQKLNNTNLKTINGGRATGDYPYYCWDSEGSYDSTIDASNSSAGIHCTPVAVAPITCVTSH